MRMMMAAAAIAASMGLGAAAQALPADWTALTAKLTMAADAGNVAELRAARAAALRAAVAPAAGVPPAIAHYTLAYADYRLAGDPGASGAEQQDLADEAEQHLRAAIKTDNRLADAYGLLSAVLGLKIARAATVEAKMTLGPESSAALQRGLSLEPANPRLLLIQGLGLFRRPAEYGGDPKQAEALFRQAAGLLDASTTAWPNWGRFDAHAWLGQALARRGDAAGAREEYLKALAVAPDSSWVKDVLLPAVAKSGVE